VAVFRIAASMAGGEPRYRILLVTNWISWAGAETQLAHLALGLREDGHSVTMLSIATAVTDVDELRAGDVELVELGAMNRWAKLRVFGRLVRFARRADLVHCTGWDATFWGRLAAIVARRPVVFTEHTPGRDLQTTGAGASRTRAIALHNRLLDRFTYATIVVGEWQRALLRAEGVRGPIVRIPNAVPVEELRRKAANGPSRAELGVPEDSLLVAEVARFAPQKGQTTVLRAVESLRDRLGDVRVLFVGKGETEAAVRAEAEARGAEWATFLGRREDVPALLRLADISILPSTGEGLPMSLIEAIVLGTPVVATDVGDVRWLIETTGAGICVAAGDDAGFERACGELLEDGSLRARQGQAGLAAGADFDAPLMVERYEEVFLAAIESTPLPADV
jgi:glycosyltransferase involved in cell wall biosynthesis